MKIPAQSPNGHDGSKANYAKQNYDPGIIDFSF